MIRDSRLWRPPATFDLFGLIADSSIDLALTRAHRKKQLEIRVGIVEPRGMALYESTDPSTFGCYKHHDELFLVWDDVRFSVTRDRVVVDAEHEESAAQLLLPAVWSVVLSAHQRESLHGSAVARLGRGVAVLGQSGSGKSTSAWGMIQRNWLLVSDDLLTFDADLKVVPGPPWLRLLQGEDNGERAFFDPGGKVRMNTPTVSCPVPLSAVIILDPHYERCTRLTGTSAVSAMLQHIYNPVLTQDGQARRRFELIHALASSVSIYAAPPRSLSPQQIESIVERGLQ